MYDLKVAVCNTFLKGKKKKREEKKDAFSSHKQPSLKFVLLKPKYTHREKGLEKPYYP